MRFSLIHQSVSKASKIQTQTGCFQSQHSLIATLSASVAWISVPLCQKHEMIQVLWDHGCVPKVYRKELGNGNSPP